MNVRLVAYRKATSGATYESTYQLDLQEEPNISLNYRFSDIKEPDTRKSSFSQTFKLPFTDKNNQFFQDWYNVNLTTLVFTTKLKFNAVLYVGTVPQFEGSLQLKGVYKKAGYYDAVLMSNTADLFSVIGEKKLRDVFVDDDGDYNEDLNHTFNETSMVNSWNGGSSAFVNIAGTSLRDTDVDVQKVMYPMSVTHPNFFWDSDSNKYLDMSAADIIDTGCSRNGVIDAFPYMVPISQFRPALQIKNILKLIIARSGFSYTSDFIDGDYFGKIFMTTGNHLQASTIPTTVSTGTSFAGNMTVGNDAQWGLYDSSYFTPLVCTYNTLPAKIVEADTIVGTDTGSWNTTYDYFTKEHPTQSQMQVRHKTYFIGLVEQGCNSTFKMVFDIYLQGYDATTNTPNPDIVYDIIEGVELKHNYKYTHYLNLSNIPVGFSCQILVRPRNCKSNSDSAYLRMGRDASFTQENLESKIQVIWDNYSQGVYGGVVNVPLCVDPDITQKEFLKDLVQRFNWVILTDPDDASNLIIEPYNTYLNDGSLKNWTTKIDTSKEIIVKDTTSLQKKYVRFNDQEDVDIANKSFKDELPEINVYGKIDITVTDNEFAKGELKNEPIFSPYINERVYINEDTALEPYPTNMAVQYETSYTKTDDGFEIINTAATKPKLFWYNGLATTVKDSNTTLTYNLHNQPIEGESINTYTFTTYPVCTPYDITPSSDTYTLSTTNKSLYWNSNPPISGQIEVFNYEVDNGTWFANTLYGLYWKGYLDNIYSDEARIMECYINLDAVDIFNFKFNDEILIKDAYWRVLEINNYQVAQKASTKVIFVKVVDALNNCNNCDKVIGWDTSGIAPTNFYAGAYYLWCPEDDPSCTPTIDYAGGDISGLITSTACCECQGGQVAWLGFDATLGGNLYGCMGDSMSLPLAIQDQSSPVSILGQGSLKSLISSKIGGMKNPFKTGVANTKYGRNIIPSYGDDMVIKYNVKRKTVPQLQGESHKFMLTGYTEGNTRVYAYPEGTSGSNAMVMPTDVNIVIRTKGTSTVIGGTSATDTNGTTEAFAYHTGFSSGNGGITQLGTAGGDAEFGITGGRPVTCTLHIDISDGILRFGLDDSATDTKRIWALSVELDINRVHNMGFGFNENWALYQNGMHIEFQNGNTLIWN